MGFATELTKLTTNFIVDTASLFVHKMKSKEAHAMLHELKLIDKKLQQELIEHSHAKTEFKHLLHKLENTLKRLIQRGEKFEAEHLHHVYEKYAQAFHDKHLIEKINKLRP